MTSEERKKIEAENRVRKLASMIPDYDIPQFKRLMNANLRKNGSEKTVEDILKELL